VLKNKSVGLRKKIIIYFNILVFIVLFISGILYYKITSDQFLENKRDEVEKLAAVSSLFIDGDIHKSFNSEADMKSEEFKEMKSKMEGALKNSKALYLYTLIKKGDKTEFVVDASEDPSSLGDEYSLMASMKDAFDGKVSSDREIYTDEWGSVLSGYAPVYDSDNKIIAIVGVDISADDIMEFSKRLINNIIITMIIGMILTIIFAFIIAGNIVRPLNRLLSKFTELNSHGGDLTREITVESSDEIAKLSEEINKFIKNIREIVININNTSGNVLDISKGIDNRISDSARGIGDIKDDIHKNYNEVLDIKLAANKSDKLISLGIDAVEYQNLKNIENTSALENVNNSFYSFKNAVEEVEGILSIITSVAKQTHILSLNALLEAARAGVHGKGFSVVAKEVSKLADETNRAAELISEILKNIKLETAQSLDNIKNVDKISKEQLEAQKETNVIFNDIKEEINLMGVKVISITEQLKSITNSIEEMNGDLKTISEDGDEFNTERLKKISMDLKKEITKFIF